jgi:Na+/phosphate symporter
LKLLEDSVVPLGVLTFIVLAVILFGISPLRVGRRRRAGRALPRRLAKYPRRALWSSLAGCIIAVRSD